MKPENRALMLRVEPDINGHLFRSLMVNEHSTDRLLDAAREEGRRAPIEGRREEVVGIIDPDEWMHVDRIRRVLLDPEHIAIAEAEAAKRSLAKADAILAALSQEAKDD